MHTCHNGTLCAVDKPRCIVVKPLLRPPSSYFKLKGIVNKVEIICVAIMRAVLCENLGDPCTPLGQGVLKIVDDQPVPELPPQCIRIKVTAASLNFPDTLQIKV